MLAELEGEEEMEASVSEERGDGLKLAMLGLIEPEDGEEQSGATKGLRLRLECTGWSAPFAVAAPVDSGPVHMPLKDTWSLISARQNNRGMEVGVRVQVARGRFHRTKTITLSPRYVLVNLLPDALHVRQVP